MIQSFLEQAERAERLARSTTDVRTYEALMKYADECRLNAYPAKLSELRGRAEPARSAIS